MNKALWTPSEHRVKHANMSRFIRFIANEIDPGVSDYATLHQLSTGRPQQFWPALWEFCGIRSSKGWDKVLLDESKMPGATWFSGARLNFAQNLLRYKDQQNAIIFEGESGITMQLTYEELNKHVAQLAAALRAEGVVKGDRVAGFMPNLPQTIIAMLATSSIGAVWSTCSPDFGINGIVDRFGQIEPKVLFATDGYFYNGKTHSCLDKIEGIIEKIPSIQKVVLVAYANIDEKRDFSGKAVSFNNFLVKKDTPPLVFEQLPFDHPLYIMYSSGTTGAPKCIVHGAGGTLIQHLKELTLHTDLKREDNIFYFTTCGWMMWNWLVSSLAVGSTVTLYDGSPFHQGPSTLFNLIDKYKISVFGTSAKWISAVEKAGYKPKEHHSFDSLRTILSTGSPLMPESFDYVYNEIKEHVCLSSIAGGTDIISCFALGNPILPVYRGELQCLGLGMKVETYDDDGQSVTLQQGELCCTQPFPCMPIGFWDDNDGQKYHNAYFSKYENIWHHGDLAEITSHAGLIIHGRSDATLNPGGVRIGTAEIYRQVESLNEVIESVAVGQNFGDDVRVVLAVILAPQCKLDDALIQKICRTIRKNTTPRHVPAVIFEVNDIPRTISGKISEIAVRDSIHGKTVKNTDALANPESLAQFKDRAELSE